MTHFEQVAVPSLDTMQIEVVAPSTVKLSGTLAVAEPRRLVGPFLKAVHEAAQADKLKEVDIDVRELTFVNSSAIRLFVDWVEWIRDLQPDKAYRLRFHTDRRVTWQRTSFAVLESLAGKAIAVGSE